MIPSVEVRHLRPWEEAVGVLTELVDEEDENSPAGAGDTGRGDENCAQTTGATE
ncbi:MAG: hypothetical protein XD72_2216 [Methanothrix harundinacea]|uniref:Uncharacterized protein n=1 Tax=Methanothrix harundinacea TaxID=301375 RepID=A0A117LEW9_9EURY|nr:MAG: hypothetical protein XD72_2216 [Methanothrix harundinacea]